MGFIFSLLRIIFLLAVFLFIIAIIFSQMRNFDEYRYYFTEDRKPVSFRIDKLSEKVTQKAIEKKFAKYNPSCHYFEGKRMLADRACAIYVKSYNDVPTLFISFFFYKDHLTQAIVQVAWWSHEAGYKQLVETLGEPDYTQHTYQADDPLYAWRLSNGGAIFYNRERSLNPLSRNGIYWRSPRACRETGCFNDN